MKKVFISYAKEDTDVASLLHMALEDLDVSGWLDQSDISSGDAIADKVKESIRKANAMIVLITPRSIKSQWVGTIRNRCCICNGEANYPYTC